MNIKTLITIVLWASVSLVCNGYAGEVTGSFQLENTEYCVGEPILVEFSVTNDSDISYSFDVGGDYRGTLRHDRFSFKVTNDSGQAFNHKLWGNMGGIGTTITLAPGEKYIAYQLLSAWVHLLPPGDYSVTCSRKLSLDSRKEKDARPVQAHALTISGELKFSVVEYDHQRIVESLRRMKKTERIDGENVKKFWSGKPVGWIISDISDKLQLGVTQQGDDNEFITALLKALPEHWNDRYYLEYEFQSNRNWLTADRPEDYRLTFSVRNNSTGELPHDLTNSTLSVDGISLREWPDVLKEMLKAAGIGETVKPGQTLEISGKFNDFLESKPKQQVVWKIREITKTTDVRFREKK